MDLFSCSSITLSLKSNILLDSGHKAFLVEFRLSNVIAEASGPLYVTLSIGGSICWAAPECFYISEGSSVSTVTTQGNIYSYSSTMLQICMILVMVKLIFSSLTLANLL
jgi:hypothetical protein